MQGEKKTGYPSIDKPWLKYYSEAAICSEAPECTMYEYIRENNAEHLGSNAVTYLGAKITYKKLLSAIDQTAAAFSALGVQHGDVVTIQSLTIPQVIFSIYALSKIGAIANLVYANMDGPAMCASMAETGSRILVIMEPIFKSIKDDLAGTDLKAVIVMRVQDELDAISKVLYNISTKTQKTVAEGCVTPWKDFFNAGQGKEATVIGRGSDPAIMVYTGGTTGKSKAVVLSNNNVNAAALQYLHLGFERGKTMLCSLPPFIAFGIVVTIHTPLAFGLNTALCVTRDLSEIGSFVQRYRPNYIICGTAQAEKLMANLQQKKIDLSFLRCLSLGGDMLPEKTESILNEFLISHNAKIRIAQGYAILRTALNIKNRNKRIAGIMTWDEFYSMGKSSAIKDLHTEFEENAIAAIVHTGGTTGVPKGVLLTNENLNGLIYQMQNGYDNFARGQSFLNILPPFIALGLNNAMHLSACLGLKSAMIASFEPEDIPKLLLKHKPNVFLCGPIHLKILLKDQSTKNQNLSFLQVVCSGGDKMPKEEQEAAQQFLKAHNSKAKLWLGYWKRCALRWKQ